MEKLIFSKNFKLFYKRVGYFFAVSSLWSDQTSIGHKPFSSAISWSFCSGEWRCDHKKCEHRLKQWDFSLCSTLLDLQQFGPAPFSLSCAYLYMAARALLQGKWCCIYNREAGARRRNRERESEKEKGALVKRIDFLMRRKTHPPCAHQISNHIARLRPFIEIVRALYRIALALLRFYMLARKKCPFMSVPFMVHAAGLKLIYQTHTERAFPLDCFLFPRGHQLTSVLQERQIFNTILRLGF